jgi:uncharacterized protein (DUF1684 family)
VEDKMNDLETFRAEKDRFFATHPQSPLTHEQRHDFNGLEYFPENEDLRLEVEVEKLPEREQILMQTSTGDVQEFIRYGKLQFWVEGEEAELTIYANQHGFFLPFVDSLAGVETYPAGRYLDPEPLDDGRFLIDFNLAYNPYCAYNELYSCPLPPAENRLKVPIRAGEKIFRD